MLVITPTEKKDITHISCPHCGEKLPRIGLTKNSQVKGLTFRCRRCQKLWEIQTK